MARDLEKALDSTLDDMIHTKRGGGKGNRDRAKGKGKGKKAEAGAAAEKRKAVAKKAPKAKAASEKAAQKPALGAAQALDMSLEDIVKKRSRKEKAPAAPKGKDSKAKKLWGGAAKILGKRRKSDEAKGKGKGKGKKQRKTKGKGKGAWDDWGGASWSDPWSSYEKGKGKSRDASWGGKGKGKKSWGGKGGGKKGDSWSSKGKGKGKYDYWEPAPKKEWGSRWEAPRKSWGFEGKGGGKDSWDSAPAPRPNKRARTEASWDSPAWSPKKDISPSWQKKEAERWGQKERGSDTWGAKEREPRRDDWQDVERSERRRVPAREDRALGREDWGTGQRGQKRAYEEASRLETRDPRDRRSSTKIKVTNIPRDLDMHDIKDAFEAEAGKIHDVQMARGTALITFGNPKDARKAVETFDRGELNGRTIEVTFAQ